MRSVFLILLLAGCISGKPLTGQSISSGPEIKLHYLSLDTDGGNALLSVAYRPGEPGYIRLAAVRDFLFVLLHQSVPNKDAFFKSSSGWIDQLGELPDITPEAPVALAEVHLYRAVLAGLMSDYQSAGIDLLAAYRIVSRLGADWEASDRNRLSGILGVLLDQVPDPWRKWLPVLGVRTSGLSGFNGLSRYYSAAPAGSADRLEGYLLMLTALREFDEDPGAARAFALSEGLPMMENPLVAYQSAMALLKAGDSPGASDILARMDRQGWGDRLPYCRYQLGRCLVYLDRAESRMILDRFAGDNPGEGYRHSAELFVAWYDALHGDTVLAAQDFKKIRSFPEPVTFSDRRALREAESGRIPDAGLLRTRMLLDGGRFGECLGECGRLIGEGRYGMEGRAELVYRMGRSAQRLGRDSIALDCFTDVLGYRETLKSYMVPNAALQLGYLCKKEGRKDPALHYFQTCLEFNRYEYRDGISRQAQRAIRELTR